MLVRLHTARSLPKFCLSVESIPISSSICFSILKLSKGTISSSEEVKERSLSADVVFVFASAERPCSCSRFVDSSVRWSVCIDGKGRLCPGFAPISDPILVNAGLLLRECRTFEPSISDVWDGVSTAFKIAATLSLRLRVPLKPVLLPSSKKPRERKSSSSTNTVLRDTSSRDIIRATPVVMFVPSGLANVARKWTSFARRPDWYRHLRPSEGRTKTESGTSRRSREHRNVSLCFLLLCRFAFMSRGRESLNQRVNSDALGCCSSAPLSSCLNHPTRPRVNYPVHSSSPRSPAAALLKSGN